MLQLHAAPCKACCNCTQRPCLELSLLRFCDVLWQMAGMHTQCETMWGRFIIWFIVIYDDFIIYIIWASCCFFCINMSMSILSITINLSSPRFYWTWTSLPRGHCSTFVSLLEGTILWTCEAAGLLHSRLGTQDIPFSLTASCNIPTAQCGRTWKDLVSWQRMETKDKDGMGWFNFPCLEAWKIRGLWRRWRLNHSLNKFQKLHIVTGEICSIDCNIHWYSHYN